MCHCETSDPYDMTCYALKKFVTNNTFGINIAKISQKIGFYLSNPFNM